MLRGLLDKARKLAGDAIAGKPEPPATQGQRSEAAEAAKAATDREDPEEVLRRIHAKAERGLKAEDRVVVVYYTQDELGAVAEIRRAFDGIDTTIREMDLAKEPPQTMRQLANITGVMVPPWVYINGRYWGAQFEMTSLRGCGDLELVVANRLDEIGDEARRIGKLRDSWSDEISVENILSRWEAGHILCVDDLDAWYEVGKDGKPRFFYEGGERAVDEMRTIAQQIVSAVEAEEIEAHWQFEPSVHVG
jgi:HAMP domain-containing protein